MTAHTRFGPILYRLALINGVLLLLALILLAPRWLAPQQDDARIYLEHCQLTMQPCRIRLDGDRSLELSLNSQALRPPQRIRIRVILSEPASALSWQFNGRDMPMYLPWEPMQQVRTNEYVLTTQLALCITDPNMVWQGWLQLDGDRGSEQVRIDLINAPAHSAL